MYISILTPGAGITINSIMLSDIEFMPLGIDRFAERYDWMGFEGCSFTKKSVSVFKGTCWFNPENIIQ